MIGVVYVVGVIALCPVLAVIVLRHMESEFGTLDGADFFFGAFIGVIAAAVWPITVVIGVVAVAMKWLHQQWIAEVDR